MIYDKNGNVLSTVYDGNGNSLSVAYDASGDVVFTRGSGTPLKVMTYNCGQWYIGSGSGTSDTRYKTLAETILENNNPDVLCIQEYWGTVGGSSVYDILSEYFPYIQEVNASTAYWGHCVCSKYPISNFQTENLTGNNYLDRFSISVNGISIEIFNTHLPTSSQESSKVSMAEDVFDIVKTYNRFILCGDFNTVCKSVNDTEYTTIMKQFIDAGFHSANCSLQHGFIDTYTDGSTSSGTWYPCDQIITSANIYINDVYVDTTKLTDAISAKIDHIPLIAELSVY